MDNTKGLLIFSIILLALVGSASAMFVGICYQPLPNVTQGCGEIGTPPYVNYLAPTNAEPYIFFNYTKPLGAVSAVWQVKHGWNATTSAPLLYNISIPTACFNASPDKLYLRIFARHLYVIYTDDQAQSHPMCWNGNAYVQIGIDDYVAGYIRDGWIDEHSERAWDMNYSTFTGWQNNQNGNLFYGFGGDINGISLLIRHAMFYEQSIYWNITCVENWTENQATCIDFIQFKTYTDQNACNTTLLLPADNGTSSSCGGGGGGGQPPAEQQQTPPPASEEQTGSQSSTGTSGSTSTTTLSDFVNQIIRWFAGLPPEQRENITAQIQNLTFNQSTQTVVVQSGGGGGGASMVVVSNADNQTLFTIETDTGSVNAQLLMRPSQERTLTLILESFVTSDQHLDLTCVGLFCDHVKIGTPSVVLAGMDSKDVLVNISVPASAQYGDVDSFQIKVSDGLAHSGVVAVQVDISRLGAVLEKFSLARIVLYALILGLAEVLMYFVLPKSKSFRNTKTAFYIIGGLAVLVVSIIAI